MSLVTCQGSQAQLSLQSLLSQGPLSPAGRILIHSFIQQMFGSIWLSLPVCRLAGRLVGDSKDADRRRD